MCARNGSTMHILTQRFIDVFNHLRQTGAVKSARQYALELGTYPQTLNELLKGRREVTLDMIVSVSEKYDVNPSYLLKGEGGLMRQKETTEGLLNIDYLSSFSYHSYVQFQSKGDGHNGLVQLRLPALLVEAMPNLLAIQVNESCIQLNVRSGDIIYCSLVNEEVVLHALQLDTFYVVVTQNTICLASYQGKSLYDHFKWSNETGHFTVLNKDLLQVWMPKSRLSKSHLNKMTYTVDEQNKKAHFSRIEAQQKAF